MLASKDAVLVGTSLVLAVSTIVSVTIQLERQFQTVGRLTISTCESLGEFPSRVKGIETDCDSL